MQEIEWEVVPAKCMDSYSGLWNALSLSLGCPAFLRAEFILTALDSFSDGKSVLALGRSGGSLVAAGVMREVSRGNWVSFQPSQLPLGAWIMRQDLSWGAAISALCRNLPGLPLVVSVTQQDPNLIARPVDCPNVHCIDYVSTAWVDINGSFEDYWQSRGKNLRQNLGKQRRRLLEQGRALTFECLEDPERIDAAFLEFGGLEGRGWKAEAGTGITAGNEQGLFYRRMLEKMSHGGRAIAFRLCLDGVPIAVDLGLRDQRSIVLLKTTYNEALKGMSPGQLLHEEIFRYVFACAEVDRVEFYGKVMEWHTRWTENSRMLYHVNFYRWGWLYKLRSAMRKAALLRAD